MTDRLEAVYAELLQKRIPEHQRLRFAWSGGRAHALIAGEGPPLVLVHGGLGELLQWLPVVPALAKRHRVIAVDRPGCGLSDDFDYAGVDLAAHAADFLEASLDAAGVTRAAFVGNSMGGFFSVSFALAHPARVTDLVLVGAPAGTNEKLPKKMLGMRLPGLRGLVRRAIARGKGIEDARVFLGGFIVSHPERIPDDLLEGIALSTKRNVRNGQSLLECATTWRGSFRRELLLDRWQELRVPVTFVWGEEDAFDPPSRGEALLPKLRTGSRVVAVPSAGHCPWLDEPELVAGHVLAALERHPDGKDLPVAQGGSTSTLMSTSP